MHKLTLMSGDVGWLNSLFRVVFSNRRAARTLYPLLRIGRNLVLKLLGRKQIRITPDH